jgi:hypothetical protein
LEAHKDKLIQLRGKLQKAVDNLDVSGWIYSHHVGVCDIQIIYYNIYIYILYILQRSELKYIDQSSGIVTVGPWFLKL